MRVKRVLYRGAAILFTAAFCLPSYASHSWSTYHWARTANPFDLITVHSMTSEWDTAFYGTVSEWSKSSKLSLTVKPGSTDSKVRRRCNPQDGQIVACNLSYGNNGWLGLASINLDSNGHIVRGSAKMNDFYSSYWTPEERNHVVCQEVGHLFGLGHTSTNGSSQGTCMDYSSSSSSQWPNQHDYNQLDDIYAHLDSYDSYDNGGSSGGGGECNPRSPKCSGFIFADGPPMGIPVEVGLHHEIWVAADGRGGYWVHHILVAPGTHANRFGNDGH